MKWSQATAIFFLIVSVVFVGYVPDQSDFPLIIIGATCAFIAYGYLSFWNNLSIKKVFILGVVIRLILIFAFPNLSDDIYRFIWDGQLADLNINPYGHLPSELMDENISGLSRELYGKMNSPEYYTIYPPFAQLIFYFSTWFSKDIYSTSLVIKMVFLFAEMLTFLGIIKILKALNKDLLLSAIYFLNPLILIEGMVNLHFEIIMLCFFVWSVYFIFVKNKLIIGALILALSVSSKLLPLMFLPFFFFGMKGKKRLLFFSSGLLFFVLFFSPIILGWDFQNFGSSINLYFQNFEFNGSLYYIFRYVGKMYSGYNQIQYIGPLLGCIALILILRKAYLQKAYTLQTFLDFSFFSFLTYLFFTTTVHPWYLSLPILISVFVKWRFVLIWSFLIFLTYINYSYNPYWENLWIVGIEYILVFGVIYFELNEKEMKTIPVGKL